MNVIDDLMCYSTVVLRASSVSLLNGSTSVTHLEDIVVLRPLSHAISKASMVQETKLDRTHGSDGQLLQCWQDVAHVLIGKVTELLCVV